MRSFLLLTKKELELWPFRPSICLTYGHHLRSFVFTMQSVTNALVQAVVGDFVTRLISFLIDKCRGNQISMEELLGRIEELMRPICTAVKEAEGREIINPELLKWYKEIKNMYRERYIVDTIKLHQALEKKNNDIRVATNISRSFLSGEGGINELNGVFERLKSISADAEKFYTFLPPGLTLPRRPYDTYLYMQNCMVGRHVERVQIINFLLQTVPPGARKLGILPIIGEGGVGKTTLVQHVYEDERVRNHFSQILTATCPKFLDDLLAELHVGTFSNLRILIIFDCIWFTEVESLQLKLSSSPTYVGSGSKVIVISRHQQFASLGTVEPIWLQNLPLEEYWYFFKAVAFGSTNPEDYPILASVGKETAMELGRSFLAAEVCGWLLRENPSAHFWRNCLRTIKQKFRKNQTFSGRCLTDLALQLAPGGLSWYACRRSPPRDGCIPPALTIADMLNESNIPQEQTFEVLLWKSPIPPYCEYVICCNREEPPPIMRKRKRLKGRSRHESQDEASTLAAI